METEQFGISRMASYYGISYRTLRFYEQIGLMRPKRIGSKRLYTDKDRRRLEVILKGRRLGFSLSEITQIINSMTHCSEDQKPVEEIDIVSSLDQREIAQRIHLLESRKVEIEKALVSLGEGLDRVERDIDKSCAE